jgi:hypothetical protein
LNYGPNAIAGIAGSAPLSDVVDLTGGDNFIGIPGEYNSESNTANFTFPSSLMQDTKNIYLSSANINPNAIVPPPLFGGMIWNPSKGIWQAFPQGFDPSKKTLVLVHGVNSSVEEAFGGCVNNIMAAGGYQQVVGFNYDWTQRPSVAGPLLAEFLNTLQSDGLTEVDIEAHSFGTITTLAAISQTSLNIPHMVLEGGPLNGTELVKHPNIVSLIAYKLNGFNKSTKHTLAEFFSSGVLDDLSPGSSVLTDIKTDAISKHNETSFIKIVGQTCTDLPLIVRKYVYGNNTNDCFIPSSSAAGSDLPGPAALYFSLQHDKLECDPNVIKDVGLIVNKSNEAAPEIVWIRPESAKIGDTVSICGIGLGSSQGTSYVSFNNIKAIDYISWKERQITDTLIATYIQVKVPQNTTSETVHLTTVKVSMTVNNKKSNEVDFTVLGKFDGRWEGTYSGIYTYPDGDKVYYNDEYLGYFDIKDGMIYPQVAGGKTTGSVDESGGGNWSYDGTDYLTFKGESSLWMAT